MKSGVLSRRRSTQSRYWTMYAALGLVVLLFAVLRFFPIIKLFYMSLFNWNMASGVHKFLGFRNFVRMFSSATFLSALWRTIYIGFEILLITVPLGLLIANAIHRKIWEKALSKPACLFPTSCPWSQPLLSGSGCLTRSMAL